MKFVAIHKQVSQRLIVVRISSPDIRANQYAWFFRYSLLAFQPKSKEYRLNQKKNFNGYIHVGTK